MSFEDVSLNDRYDLGKAKVLLNGTQALVRLMLMQKARDKAAGLNTGGYVTGYRGSPLGAVDLQMQLASKELKAAEVIFEPGLNEDLAATALWGTQQAELRGEGRYDGVFGLWYGKGPGVDRTGDVFRHANMAGTSAKGGVLAIMGDDHTGESSTTLHQSEWAFVDAMMPVLSPAGVQEILDFGQIGYELSRYSGCWVGLKCMKDTIEVTSVVDTSPDRIKLVRPKDFKMPQGGLNIRLIDDRVAEEARLHDFKRFAAEAFGRANRLDKRVLGKPGAQIGIVAAGKNWLDLVHAMHLLGIDEAEAERLGITTYKVAMTWPLDMTSFREWADGLDLIIVVEEKRKLLEVQVKEAIFDNRMNRRVYGWKNDRGEELFPTRYALDPMMIARKLGGILAEEGRAGEKMNKALQPIEDASRNDNAPEIASRLAYFCSGCPHNSSTKVPDGARAYAGIGCHFMVQWMDRNTLGFTHMGGEGANWIGESHFSTRDHVFQNLGDGTYNHSGVQAIRAALAAGTNITYKILFNDAVAMTGGQHNEGDLAADRIIRELKAMGVRHVAAIYDPKEEVDLANIPAGVEKHTRDQLMDVQEKYSQIKGVTAIVYIQTCAAEKRRRRKRGKFPDPDRRVVINPDVCEGCGDCGVQSNCVSIVPLETSFGRKRRIDQSSCNKDFSCINGFCPSFVTVSGAKIRRDEPKSLDLPHLPQPNLPVIDGTWNIVITGVGGTGVVTIGAILAMAAHLDGKGAGMMEMAGLAQKGGAVLIHCRLANEPGDIDAIRVAVGEADAVIGGDLVVSAGSSTLGLMQKGRARAVVNSHEIITGEFTRNTEFTLPSERLTLALQARLGEDAADFLDVTDLAKRLLGDSIYSNMMIFGAAWQRGLVPVSHAAIIRAIELNGAGVEGNKRAFDLGRWAIEHPDEAAAALADDMPEAARTDTEKLAEFERHLSAYQNAALTRRFRVLVDRAGDLSGAVAAGYHKLLTYKDEYEVARLHSETIADLLASEFEGDLRPSFHLAPPFLSGKGGDGRPRKREFGPWILPVFRLLARAKGMRGTVLDPFGYSAERQMERALIAEYEANMADILPAITPETADLAREIAELPLQIKGFGPVKEASVAAYHRRLAELLDAFRKGGVPSQQAAE
ncbi:MAG: indolepyruvate ferredoxin oxidoreductase family protein [Rhodobacteraceae bacterium]|nr:indolepyruvate ferredoxin oxidoreductase family protein [Paracoccaceae bacterium]